MSEKQKKKISNANRGRKLSKEWKSKISITLTGKKQSEETKKKRSLSMKGKNTWMNGRKFTKKHKDNLSKAAKRGKESHLWRGGVSDNKEYRSWSKNKRNRVVKRLSVEGSSHTFLEWQDKKTEYSNRCAYCGVHESVLNKRYKDKRWWKLTEDHIIPLSKN